jgi:hypothetical protein
LATNFGILVGIWVRKRNFHGEALRSEFSSCRGESRNIGDWFSLLLSFQSTSSISHPLIHCFRVILEARFPDGWCIEPGWELGKSHIPIIPFIRWDEKAGLRRDAIRSQCSTCSRHKEKETGYEKD